MCLENLRVWYQSRREIYVDDRVTCSANRPTNCFVFEGCVLDGFYTSCNGTDWSASMRFTGTGVEIWGVSQCADDPCLWTVDGDTRAGDVLRDNVYRELAFVSKDIEGGPIDEHVLALSSLASPKVSLLRIMSAQIYTDSITPLHSGDRIWVPSGMEQVRYDGRWETDQDGFQQTSEEGASVTVAFVGSQFSWFTSPDGFFGGDGFVEIQNEVRARTYLDGLLGGFNDQPITPTYHEVTMTLDFSHGGRTLGFQGLHFYPLPNMTTMGSAVLPAPKQSSISSPTSSSTAGISPTFSSNTSDPTSSSSIANSHKNKTGSIVGGIVGGIVFLGCVVAGLIIYLKTRRRELSTPTEEGEPDTCVQPYLVSRSYPADTKHARGHSPPRTVDEANIESPRVIDHSLPRQERPSTINSTHLTESSGIEVRHSQVAVRDEERMERLLRYVDDRIDAALDRPPIYSHAI